MAISAYCNTILIYISAVNNKIVLLCTSIKGISVVQNAEQSTYNFTVMKTDKLSKCITECRLLMVPYKKTRTQTNCTKNQKFS